MTASDAQQFLNDLDRKLWAAADKLRASALPQHWQCSYWKPIKSKKG